MDISLGIPFPDPIPEIRPENCRDLTLPVSAFLYVLDDMREIISCEELFDYDLENHGDTETIDGVTTTLWDRFREALNTVKTPITLSVPQDLSDLFEEWLRPEPTARY